MLLVNCVQQLQQHLSQCYSIDETKNITVTVSQSKPMQGCILQHGNSRAQIVQALEVGGAMSQHATVMAVVCIG